MSNEDLNDELEPEYDLLSVCVRKIGEGQKMLQENPIQPDADTARVFPNSTAVNEALRFLMRIARENELPFEVPK